MNATRVLLSLLVLTLPLAASADRRCRDNYPVERVAQGDPTGSWADDIYLAFFEARRPGSMAGTQINEAELIGATDLGYNDDGRYDSDECNQIAKDLVANAASFTAGGHEAAAHLEAQLDLGKWLVMSRAFDLESEGDPAVDGAAIPATLTAMPAAAAAALQQAVVIADGQRWPAEDGYRFELVGYYQIPGAGYALLGFGQGAPQDDFAERIVVGVDAEGNYFHFDEFSW
jgi:hypothetical protein